jgi:hypothetical protein
MKGIDCIYTVRSRYDAGFVHLTNVDFSACVIERMAEQHGASCPEMTWEVGDMVRFHGDSP